ncbi:COMM domain-containing protein 4-like [Glandiceps talaboti]
MRFRFCGDLDCPDWVLAEIATLSKITSIKMKLLCTQVIKELIGDTIDYEKVYKLTADAKYEIGDVKGAIAALSFILTSAGKNNVDGDSLSNELQQLGLPKEHSLALCKTYGDKLNAMQQNFKKHSLRLSHLESVEWRVDYVLSCSELQDVNEPFIHIRMKVRNPDTDQTEVSSFTMTSDKFRVFLSELKQAHKLMQGVQS